MGDKKGKQIIKELATTPNLEGQLPTMLIGQSFKPHSLLLVTTISIFAAEAFVMFLLFLLPPLSRPIVALIDGLLLSVIIFPILYCFSFRPLLKHITERKQMEEEREKLLSAYQDQNRIISISNSELEKSLARTKQVEEELRLRAQLLDAATDAILVYDLEGNLIYLNEAAYKTRGYTRDEMMRMNMRNLIPAEGAEIIAQRNKVLMEKDRTMIEGVKLHKDGRKIPVEIVSRSIELGGRKLIFSISRDITERKKMEKQLQQSKVLASLGEMTAGIAHEVNNPLGSVLLYSELLLKGDVSRQTKKDLRVMHGEAKRAARIMTDLLAYSNEVKFQKRRLNLHKIVKKVMEMRRYEERVQNINVSIELLKGPIYVKGDSSQLTQILMNLILNAEAAVKKFGAGNIIVTTRVDGEWVKVSVADDGTGIPEEHLTQVFHPFFTTKKVGEGTGLGLSTCYGIVTAHGGLIHAENNDMGGATFTVELPLAKTRRQEKLRRETEKVDSEIISLK